MKCPKCGLENRPDARFCKQCGQALLHAPPTGSSPPDVICPACGATAKAGARFCPRCGKPLEVESTPPSPATDTKPSMPSLPSGSGQASPPSYAAPPSPTLAQPPAYAQPPYQPPPPAAPPVYEQQRRIPGWAWGVGITAALICIAIFIVTAMTFGPKLVGRDGGEEAATVTPTPVESPTAEATPTEPAATPSPEPTQTPAFDAQVVIAVSAVELQPGSVLTVTVTITNTGQVTFGNLRYQLLGEWEPFLGAPTGAAVSHEVDVPPGGSDTATFLLEAMQPGAARLYADVTVDTREDPSSTRPISSQYVVEVSVVQ